MTKPVAQKTDSTLEHVFRCAHAALEKRASNPVVVSVSDHTSYADYFLILGASSDRRAQTIADAVIDAMAEEGIKPLGVEGMREGRWVLIDFGAWVVHVFYEELRPFFNLEGLWSDAPRIAVPPAPQRAPGEAGQTPEVEG